MLALSALTLSRGGTPLIENASLTVCPGQKIGVIGRNGCGKSSLFAAVLGEIAPDRGSVSLKRGLRVAHVAQQSPALEISALQYVIEGDSELNALRTRRDAALRQGDGTGLGELEEELGQRGEWTIKSRAAVLLHGLGFKEADGSRPVREFSGGWRMRLNLARALISPADLLLLDEPTNHLDLDAILFLENYLKASRGTIMCISHDRAFLNSFVSHILRFEAGRLVLYTGNYDAYEKTRALRIQSEKAARAKEEAALAQMRSFVERFRCKATKARQAQSLLKAIERLSLTAVTQEESPYSVSFRDPGRTVGVLADLRDVDAGYGSLTVLRGIRLSLNEGDRVGLIGRNGQGKSTLIKTLCAAIPPLKGSVVLGKGVRPGYFAQHELEQLREDLSALDHLRLLDPAAREKDLRSFLGTFAFSGPKALVEAGKLSGGEQARLALALVAYRKPNLLLLDEPTNHLDLEMREALSVALTSYQGALILVSHDRFLLESAVNRLWLAESGRVTEFEGDLSDYRAYLSEQNRLYRERRAQAGTPSQAVPLGRERRRSDALFRQSLSPLKRSIAELEGTMERCRAGLEQIDRTLAEGSVYAHGGQDLEELLKERAAQSARLEELEQDWLSRSEELEQRLARHESAARAAGSAP